MIKQGCVPGKVLKSGKVFKKNNALHWFSCRFAVMIKGECHTLCGCVVVKFITYFSCHMIEGVWKGAQKWQGVQKEPVLPGKGVDPRESSHGVEVCVSTPGQLWN